MSERKKWNMNDPDIRRMVEQVKSEIAGENGLELPTDGYFGHISSKKLGEMGPQLRKRISILLDYQQKLGKRILKKKS